MKHTLFPSLFALLLPVSFQAPQDLAGAGDRSSDPVLDGQDAILGATPGVTRSTVLAGRVVTPEGEPAPGAVVVSNAGGQAVTDAQGRFRLEIARAAAGTQVQLTAVQAGQGSSLVAGLPVPILNVGGTATTRDLRLAAGSTCEPSWLPTFGGAPVFEGSVHALAVYDDGSGPALYVSAAYSNWPPSTVPRGLWKWDGSSWLPVGGGIGGGEIFSMAVFDDGSGPALFVGGTFSNVGGWSPAGTSANRIAKWDGSTWSPLGPGLNDWAGALVVHDDGSGPALYVGGVFTTAGGANANHIARWDGTTWSPLGAGTSGVVHALAIHDEGSGGGPALFVGGDFTVAGGVAASHIARWDAGSWSALGSGVNSRVRSMAVYDDGLGAGPALHASGDFVQAGGGAAQGIAKWDGANWSPLGSGLIYEPGLGAAAAYDLLVFDDGAGGGPALFAGGTFIGAGGSTTNFIARWNGATWSGVGGGMNSTVNALAIYDDGAGGGPILFVGGSFVSAGGVSAPRLAHWNGTNWSSVGGGLRNSVKALTVYDDGAGGGPSLYAGGTFTDTDGSGANRIAKWNGASWTALGSGLNNTVLALTVYDDGVGGGPALYASGLFTSAGGTGASRIARWNGSSWSPLASGLNGEVRALLVHDEGLGEGPTLFAGGGFTGAGGTAANRIARWNGSSWSALGSGVDDWVLSLAEFDDGSGNGPALYVGGRFATAGGLSAGRIARWDGGSWFALGGGVGSDEYLLPSWVASMAPRKGSLGNPGTLYVGGRFLTAGNGDVFNVAQWSGTDWAPLGTGLGNESSGVEALALYDDGTGGGAMLYAAGDFAVLEGLRIKKWDGSAWTFLDVDAPHGIHAVNTLQVFDQPGGGQALVVGGTFVSSPAGDSFVALWGGCTAPVGVAYCFGDGSGNPCPCANAGGAGEGCANSSGPGAVLAGAGTGGIAANDLLLHAAQLLPGQPALMFAGLNAIQGGSGIPFGDGLRCVGGQVLRLGVRIPSPAGLATWGPGLASQAGWQPGDLRRLQVWYRDPAGPCGGGFNYSNAFELSFTN